MNNLGVFGWIRESVRRSVLLGFSDAVEQLGTVDGSEPLNPQLAAVLRQSAPAMLADPVEHSATKQQRKRLGRSLDQLRNAPPAKPAGGSRLESASRHSPLLVANSLAWRPRVRSGFVARPATFEIRFVASGPRRESTARANTPSLAGSKRCSTRIPRPLRAIAPIPAPVLGSQLAHANMESRCACFALLTD